MQKFQLIRLQEMTNFAMSGTSKVVTSKLESDASVSVVLLLFLHWPAWPLDRVNIYKSLLKGGKQRSVVYLVVYRVSKQQIAVDRHPSTLTIA